MATASGRQWSVSGPAIASLPADDGAAALQEDDVAPAVAVLADALAAAHLAEAAGAVKRQARFVLGHDAGLEGPDPGVLGVRDEALEQPPSNPPAPGVGGDVDAHLGHPPVHGPLGDRGQRDPPDDPVPSPGHQAALPQVAAVPGVPGGRVHLERRVAAGDALLVDPPNRGPVLGAHRFDGDVAAHAGFDAFSEKNSGRVPSSSAGSRWVASSRGSRPGDGHSRNGNSWRNSIRRPFSASAVTISPSEWFHPYSCVDVTVAVRSA